MSSLTGAEALVHIIVSTGVYMVTVCQIKQPLRCAGQGKDQGLQRSPRRRRGQNNQGYSSASQAGAQTGCLRRRFCPARVVRLEASVVEKEVVLCEIANGNAVAARRRGNAGSRVFMGSGY